MQMKRALLVGIDHYDGMPLKGCVADATGMAAMLHKNSDGSRNYDIRLVVSGEGQPLITRQSLRALLRKLFDESRGMALFFFFAGHGAKTPWGSELVTQDYPVTHDGVLVNDVVTLANASAATDVVIVLDSCFAGDVGHLKDFQYEDIALPFRFGRALLREDVTILSATRPAELAVEKGGHGSFTRLLLEGLEGGAADHLGNVSAQSLYDYASAAFGAFEQRPMLKSHVTRPVVLRTCKSPISPDEFAMLVRHFESAYARIQLSQEYEGERPIPAGKSPTPQQQAFDYFKVLRNAGLLTTEDNIDLYYAALNGKQVFLTPRGQYLWRLADKERG